MPIYIDTQRSKPYFFWDNNVLLRPLSEVRYHQGRLGGRMAAMPGSLRREASLAMMALEVARSAELDGDVVSDTSMVLDAFTNFDQPLTEKRLTDWHRCIAPAERRRANPLVHYQRPGTHAAPAMVRTFLQWFNSDLEIDPVIKAGVAHWWFMMIRPFDGNDGRIARSITHLQLARGDNSGSCCYSLSDVFCSEREGYTRWFSGAIEAHSAVSTDMTRFLEWFLYCVGKAVKTGQLSPVMKKAAFREVHAIVEFNERQRMILDRLLDGSETRLTSSLWARLTATSSDTAIRDINDLVAKGVLAKEAGGGRSTSYVLVNG